MGLSRPPLLNSNTAHYPAAALVQIQTHMAANTSTTIRHLSFVPTFSWGALSVTQEATLSTL